jgi:type II secretory ATPase GspE/PulE/Tfp pilus assembly ATPase PilB-like protein
MASIEDLLGHRVDQTRPSRDSTPQEQILEKMKELRFKAVEEQTEAEAAKLGFAHINLVGFPVSPEAISLIPRAQAREVGVVCFYYDGSSVRLASTHPAHPDVEEVKFQVEERSHAQATLYMISPRSLEAGLKVYDNLPEIKELVKGVEITEADLQRFQREVTRLGELDQAVQKTNITDFLTLVIALALSSGVSDIHIEAQETEVDVKYRIDGILQKVAHVKRELWPRIVSRVKLFSGLKLNVTSVPQDGRFTIFTAAGQVDVRVSTLPSAYGESIVMRLLKPSSINLRFEDLGLRGLAYEQLKAQAERPNGMIVTTGPTGSGKTTTLYSILSKLNNGETKIITLEDPVEYRLGGIVQSQIDKSMDYTFAKGLNSILRQDPDVVMVGELRDLETAEVAIQAALTGHLVVSTIHTNSAAGAVPRFLSMGVKPFLLAPALNAVIGQRLVRRICPDCKAPDEGIPAARLARIKDLLGKLPPNSGYRVDFDGLRFYKGRGCETCGGIGYKGRVGIYEVMAMSEAIEQIILSGKVSEYDMQRIAMEQGMITMAQDGLLKALEGTTSVDEVFRAAE